jgi:hypothetical protein
MGRGGQRRYIPNRNRKFRDEEGPESNRRRPPTDRPRKFTGGKKFKPIQRNRKNNERSNRGKERRGKKEPASKDDLDREMRQYWVKVGSKEKV